MTVVDGTKEVRITLAWTEQPGNPGSPYVAKNNLDLIAYSSPCFPCFFGNYFSSSTGYSIPAVGGPGDTIDNVEEIVIQPNYFTSGTVLTVQVNATSLTTNGLDYTGTINTPLQQDFVVFASNAH